jgi:hypothetical protein
MIRVKLQGNHAIMLSFRAIFLKPGAKTESPKCTDRKIAVFG